MPATPKAKRTPPARTFENYTLTRALGGPDAGLVKVAASAFKPCSPALSGSNPGAGWSDEGYSVAIPIGFDFLFDGRTYNRFVACTNGWMALVDPATGTFTSQEVMAGSSSPAPGTMNDPTLINAVFTTNAALLCPWFDNLRNNATDLSQLGSSALYSATKLDRVRKGLEPPVVEFNQAQYGVSYHNSNSPNGRRLVVRWNSVTNNTATNTTLRFEVVLYENGDIEFRYDTRDNLTLSNNGTLDGATIGIFMPNSSSPIRFRDFSAGLGYNDTFRTVYKYGGYVSSSAFSDVSNRAGTLKSSVRNSFAVNLTPFNNWPSNIGKPATIAFRAPRLRREVLPRLAIGELDSRTSMPLVAREGMAAVEFDDKETPMFVSGVVNYPTTLPRLYGGSSPSTGERQNLFTGDFEVTASISKAAVDAFMLERPKSYMRPFSEDKQPEQNVNALNDYFATGSSLSLFSNQLDQRLQAKTIVRMSLPVERSVVMFPTSSVIMYYRPKSRSWAVPSNSSYIIGSGSSTNDSGYSRGDIANLQDAIHYGRIIEDEEARGFGFIGNRVSSGSLNNVSQLVATDSRIGVGFGSTNMVNALMGAYANSVSSNQNYAATKDETFSIPITEPLLVEKMVIELPFAMGDGWFKNRTTSFLPLDNLTGSVSGSFDFAGPALTVALFNQVKAGSGTRLDLIMTGTITHQFDDYAAIRASANPPFQSGMYIVRPEGYRAYGGLASAIINPISTSVGYVFTGSVKMQLEAGVSNGVITKWFVDAFTFGAQNATQTFRNIFASPTITLDSRSVDVQGGSTIAKSCVIASVNPLSRGATGFGTSVRSVYGKEYPSFPNLADGVTVRNPFYFTGSNPNTTGTGAGLPTQLEEVLTIIQNNNNNYMRLIAAIPVMDYRQSPYLVKPGDKLVLAVSKSRPVVWALSGSTAASAYQTSPTLTSGSISDDVQLITGTINISLYGSSLSQNVERHDVINQPLGSNAVHELFIGERPTVSDQFYGDYLDAYSGSYIDDVAMGGMVNVSTWNGVTGSLGRGRAFSKTAPRSAPWSPGLGPFDSSYSISKQLQPYYELAGTTVATNAVSSTERIWDSMMPSIAQCFAADGCGIFLRDQSITPLNNTDLNFVDPTAVDTTTGYIWFDYCANQIYSALTPLVNLNWTWAYPFEPRYSNAARQTQIEKSLLASYVEKGGTPNLPNPTVTALATPIACSGLIFGPVGTQVPSVPRVAVTDTTPQMIHSHWLVDVITNQLNQNSIVLGSPHQFTGSAGVSDIVKALYGFGDLNNIIYAGASDNVNYAGLRFGTNHFADSRWLKHDEYSFTFGYGSNYAASPIIRGWKYGVWSGLPSYTMASYRTNRYGQFRDMLEQRLYTKLFIQNDPALPTTNTQQGVTVGVVNVKFVDKFGNQTKPENTWSFNLSIEATSSKPYFDGLAVNRPPINTSTLNVGILNVSAGQFGNVTI